MADILLVVIAALLAGIVVLQIVLLRRASARPVTDLAEAVRALGAGHERTERALRDEIGRARDESSARSRELREELSGAVTTSLRSVHEATVQTLGEIGRLQREQLAGLAQQVGSAGSASEKRLEALRGVVDERLRELQRDNAERLETMRLTVDEKLQGTLERRLGESFKLVGERLEQVHKGLGEMQQLASGVGDLKRILANVKTRGTWGEMQLAVLLEQMLTPDQYEANVATRPRSSERVEFALRLPGRDDGAETVWLPIDSKFPMERYEAVLAAQRDGDAAAVARGTKELETAIRASARSIRDKYLNPPNTTDFAFMFLPSEGLYAEVMRQAGLAEQVQRELRVVIAGPTTLASLLNALQIGFRTLAVQKRSSEVWAILGAVKSEFGKFGDILESVQKKLAEASGKIDLATRKSRVIERRLGKVQQLPVDAEPEDAPRLAPADPSHATLEWKPS